MLPRLAVSLRPDLQVGPGEPGTAVLQWPEGRITLRQAGPGLAAALSVMTGAGDSESELGLRVGQDGPDALMRWYYHLERWRQLRLLRYALWDGDRRLLRLIPFASDFRPALPEPHAAFRLSRFAYWRGEGGRLVLESPRVPARTEAEPDLGARLTAALMATTDVTRLAAALDLGEPAGRAIAQVLQGMGLLAAVDGAGRDSEQDDPTLAQWEFPDLLFHARTRGRSESVAAGSFRFAGAIPPLPAVKPAGEGPVHAFARADPDSLGAADPPFGRVVEARRSVRRYGEAPITAAQLGEFLFRVARVRRVYPAHPEAMPDYQLSSRPYPSGGSSYELELYPAVATCEGLEPGLYHYDPQAHALRQVAGLDARVQSLLTMAALGTGEAGFRPQVLITLAARFPRVSWKYERVAYSLVLKDVGVLYQSMYLTATAMGLAPCALGGGDADLFAAAAGTDYYVESSVGDFLLGSLADR